MTDDKTMTEENARKRTEPRPSGRTNYDTDRRSFLQAVSVGAVLGTGALTYPGNVLAAPDDWKSADVGALDVSGSTSIDSGTFVVEAGGEDIWGDADEFRYVYQHLAGDGTIVARVDSVESNNDWTRAGVMVRDTLDPGAQNVMVRRPGYDTSMQWRATAGGSTTSTTAGAPSNVSNGRTQGKWLRLERTGDEFTGYASSDGSTWTEIATTSVSMDGPITVGLALTSHQAGSLATATFSNVSLSGFETGSGFSGDDWPSEETDPIPWQESFDQPNGTTVDDGDTAWQVASGGASGSVQDGSFTITGYGGEARWYSEPIDISGADPVDISVDIRGSGTLEGSSSTPTPVGGGLTPTDPDSDGVYEDVNGNGRLDFDDVVTLANNVDSSAVQDDAGSFDINCNDSVGYDDATSLGQQVHEPATATECSTPVDHLRVAYVIDGFERVVTERTDDVASEFETVTATAVSGETLQVVVSGATDGDGAYHVGEVRVNPADGGGSGGGGSGTANLTWNGNFSDPELDAYRFPNKPDDVRWRMPPYGEPTAESNYTDGELGARDQTHTRNDDWSVWLHIKNDEQGSEPEDCDFSNSDMCNRRRAIIDNHGASRNDDVWMARNLNYWTFSVYVPDNWDMSYDGGWGPQVCEMKPSSDSVPTFTIMLEGGYWYVRCPWTDVIDPDWSDVPWQQVAEYTHPDHDPYIRQGESREDFRNDFPDVQSSFDALQSVNRGGWTDWVVAARYDVRSAGEGGNGMLDVYKREAGSTWTHVIRMRPRQVVVGGDYEYDRGVGIESSGHNGYRQMIGMYGEKSETWNVDSSRELWYNCNRVYDGSSDFDALTQDAFGE